MAYEHTIDTEGCKGCGLCVTVCPKNVLEISNDVDVIRIFSGLSGASGRLHILRHVLHHVPGCCHNDP